MTTTTDSQLGIIRTNRGLTIAGTRITLYSIMDYLEASWPRELIRDRLNLSNEQIDDALEYIQAHDQEIRTEYESVLRCAEENRQYWHTRNQERFAQIAVKDPPPDKKAVWDKIRAKKKQLGLS